MTLVPVPVPVPAFAAAIAVSHGHVCFVAAMMREQCVEFADVDWCAWIRNR